MTTCGRWEPYGKVADFFEGVVTVWELVKSGGWMMLPIILSSIAAMAIVAERLWTLRASRVTPPHLLGQVWRWIQDKQLNSEKLKALRADSPLGEIQSPTWPTKSSVIRFSSVKSSCKTANFAFSGYVSDASTTNITVTFMCTDIVNMMPAAFAFRCSAYGNL